jgi:hypothetical protein
MAIQAQQQPVQENKITKLESFSHRLSKPHAGAVSAEEVNELVSGLIGLRKHIASLPQVPAASFAQSNLAQALSNDSVWKFLTNTNENAQEPAPKKDDMENFFLLVFKFMKADHSMNTQLQLNSMANMAVQSNMLDRLSKQASDNMTDMDSQIQQAIDDKPSIWLSVVLPIAIAVVGALLGGLTFGSGSAATEAAEAGATKAITEGVETTAAQATKSLSPMLTKAAGAALTAGAAATPAILQAKGVGVDKSGEEASIASAEHQAQMSVISASMESTQGRIKQETSTQQNASSNEQADLSMLQQQIQAQQQAFGLGKL